MINKRPFIRKLIVEIVFFVVIHAMLSTLLYAFFGDLLPILMTFLLLIPYFGMFYIRDAKNIAIFLGAHIALVAWPLLLPVIWTPLAVVTEQLPGAPLSYLLAGVPVQQIAPLRMCWFVFMLISAIRSIYSRLTGRHGFDSGYLCFGIVVLTVLSLISGYYGMGAITAFNAVWAFLLIAGYLIYSQTIRIDESLDIFKFSDRKPATAIVRFNNSILLVFLIPVIMFAALSPWLPLDSAAGLLGAVLVASLRGLFNFIGWLMALFRTEPEEVPDELPPPMPEQDFGPVMDEAPETPAWLALLEMIFNIMLQIFIVAVIAAALAYGAYRFYKRFIATRGTGVDANEGADISEYIGPRLALKPIAEAIGSLLRRFSPKTEAERIRQLYYKKVRWHIKRGAEIKGVDTTREIAAKIQPAEDIGELTALYEGARYGDPAR